MAEPLVAVGAAANTAAPLDTIGPPIQITKPPQVLSVTNFKPSDPKNDPQSDRAESSKDKTARISRDKRREKASKRVNPPERTLDKFGFTGAKSMPMKVKAKMKRKAQGANIDHNQQLMYSFLTRQ